MQERMNLLTIREASSLLKVHPNTLRSWDKSGILQAIRLGKGNSIRYRRNDILHLLHNGHLHQTLNPNDTNKLLLQVSDRVPAMIAVYNIHTGQYIYVNRAIKKLLGYTSEEFIRGGLSFVSSLVHPDDLQPLMEKNQKALVRANKTRLHNDNEPVINFEYRMRHKNGTWRWLHTDGSVLNRTTDNQIEHVLNVSVDITGRKKAEEKAFKLKDQFKTRVSEIRNSLTISEERFRLIAQKVKDYAIFMLDSEGRVISWNPGAQKIKGYKTKEILGRHFSLFYTQQARDNHKPQKALSISIKKGRYEEEGVRVRKDGSIFWAHVVITPLIDEQDRLQGFVKVTSDITEAKRSRERKKLLDKINTITASSFKEKISLKQITQYIVKNFADYCRIALVGENNQLVDIVVHHNNRKHTKLAEELYDNYKNDPNISYGVHHILKTRKAEMISHIDDILLKAIKDNPLLVKNIESLGLRSYIGVPLIAQGNIIGAMTFSSVRKDRLYNKQDFLFAQEIGRRIALYVDNNKLYREAQEEIEERRKIQTELLDNQQRLELAQKVGRIGTYEWDLVTKKIYWSPELEMLYGLKPGTFGGTNKDWQKFIAAEDRKKLDRQYKEQLLQGDETEFIFKIKLNDKSLHWIYSKSKVFFGKKNKPVRIVGINMDITDRINIENNLEFLAEASKILSSSLDYQVTLNSVAQLAIQDIADWCGVDMIDDQGVLQQVAVAHKDPRKVKWARLYRRENPPNMEAKTGLPNVLKTGKSEFYPVITEEMIDASAPNEAQRKLIKTLNMQSIMVVPLFSQKKPIGAITFIATQTGKHYTEQDLDMAEEMANRASLAIENSILYRRSQDAITLRDDFISVASHELKTPITSVKIFTQVLRQHLTKTNDRKAYMYIEKMERQLNKLTELIHNLLDISKIQTGRIDFNNKVFDFDQAILEIIDILQASAPKHKIIVTGHTGEKIYGDEDRIEQVVSNLVSNAIKYSPTAHEIHVNLSRNGDSVVLAVKDFGIGMSKEHLNRIFERFYRVYDTTDRTFPGLGIGLYISNEIIERHHGKLWVESESGQGSTFYFSLPLFHN